MNEVTRPEFDSLRETVARVGEEARRHPVSRSEFDDLRTEVRQLAPLATQMAVLGAQLSTLSLQVAELKSGVEKRFDAHEQIHQKDTEARSAGRHWLITTGIAGLAAMIGLYGWIALFLRK
jgi:RNase adaptor protein for sRNA GlmZ degradation